MDTTSAFGTVLITGASSGIGLHLAHQFAASGNTLILVAEDSDDLAAAARDLKAAHGTRVEVIPCDLRDPEAIDGVLAHLGQRPIDVLVNNAGVGQRGKFWDIPLNTHLDIIQLNIAAVVHLTSALLPGMLQRGRGGILNTASVAGFEPGPMVAVYHATKAFVLSWSEALSTELDGTGVHATALCPGPTDTDFFERADMENTRAFQQAKLMAPQEVAQIGYEAFLNRERVVVPGAMNKAMVASRRLFPESLQAAKNEKLYENVAPEDRTRHRGDKENRAA